MLCPPPLRAGDLIRVVAPAGPFDRALYFRALAFLRTRYRVRWVPCRRPQGFLSASDAIRVQELNDAFRDPEARAVLTARGGYGCLRLANQLDTSSLLLSPKWLIGFSDITTLHLELQAAGIASLHAPNVTHLGAASESRRADWVAGVESLGAAVPFGDSVRPVIHGRARGPLWGGNLTLIHAHAAAGRLHLPRGCVLFLEEVGEAPYRIDRMLTSLLLGGHLDGLAGVCLGQLTACGSIGLSPSAADVLAERLAPLGVPILGGFEVGHDAPNHVLPLGLPVALDSAASPPFRLDHAAPPP